MPRPAQLRRWLSTDLRWLVVGALLVGGLLRLLVAWSPELGRLNSDQAVHYLMARHLADGELPAFFWGQQYGGSLLQTTIGLLFLVTGPEIVLLPLLGALVSVIVAVLTWRVGVAAGAPAAGAIAGAALAVGPPTWIYLGVASESFFVVGSALSLASLLLVLHRRPMSVARAAAAGALAGLAVWQSPLSVLTVLPAACLLLPAVRDRPKRGAPQLLAFVVGGLAGAAPFLHAVLLADAPLSTGFVDQRTGVGLVESAVTSVWGQTFTRFAPEQAPRSIILSVAVVVLLAALAVGLREVVRLPRGRADLVTLALLLPVLLWVPFYMQLRLPADEPATRYALPLLPFVALWAFRWWDRSRRAVWVPVALAVYSAAGLWQATGTLASPDRVLHSRSYGDLIDLLLEQQRTAVYADYWVSYRLAAESDERIVAHPPSQPRYAPYEQAAREAPRTTFVVFAEQANDAVLSQHFAGDPGVVRLVVGPFAVFLADRQVQAPGLGAASEVVPEDDAAR